MESTFAQQMKEEVISSRIGLMEDLEDMRQEEEEKRRKMLRKKGNSLSERDADVAVVMSHKTERTNCSHSSPWLPQCGGLVVIEIGRVQNRQCECESAHYYKPIIQIPFGLLIKPADPGGGYKVFTHLSVNNRNKACLLRLGKEPDLMEQFGLGIRFQQPKKHAEPLDLARLEVASVVQHYVVRGIDGALPHVLRHQEKVLQVPSSDGVVQDGAGRWIARALSV
ncbi:hypothetical protein NQ318_000353 [Aromia moschata]|uniref:Uncharacterized protein n=1 Tax=Aromia moschata TaxID=1265417 RepID=A0AAV8XTG3_9CUCU|nr:hypothetical protein NQ318_000353 [Aromia moschata]